MEYKVHMDFAKDPALTECECDGCEWVGTADELQEIGECSLTPGDPSPAGRCPDCGTLAYVVKPS